MFKQKFSTKWFVFKVDPKKSKNDNKIHLLPFLMSGNDSHFWRKIFKELGKIVL